MNNPIQLPEGSPMLQPNFVFGVATSSFQIEGDANNRLPCIWDTFCATPGKIADNSHGLIACEHVDRMEQDVELIASLNVDAYRFSISWPRVMTQDQELNESGIQFYERLIAALTARGITSHVTLYHWDLPQYLEDAGGWLNRDTVEAYAVYVDAVVARLGDSVASYATFNEPFCSAFLGYEIGVHAPGKTGVSNGRTAAHHILVAHGLGMKAIRRHTQSAKAGIVLNFTPCYPNDDSEAAQLATKTADEYINQWYIKPLFDGAYPDVINKLSQAERPPIVDGDFEIMGQSLDFLGINYYTRLTYSAPHEPGQLYFEHPHRFPRTDIGWEIFPEALTTLLVGLSNRYDLPPIYITENGAAMKDALIDGRVRDTDRIDYYQQHLLAVNTAIEQGVNVAGYFAWSLMDNFEWAEGYLKRFGLVYVDYATQQRILKDSAHAYSGLIKQRNDGFSVASGE